MKSIKVFEILIQRLDQVFINKKKRTDPAENRVEIKESGKINKSLDFVIELKKAVELKGDDDTNCIFDALGIIHKD